MEITPYARIDFEPSRHGGGPAKLGICPYAAILWDEDSGEGRTVTDYFLPQGQLWHEIESLSELPAGTEITPELVTAIGLGCQEIGGHSIARLQWVSGLPVAAPRLADDAIRKRGPEYR